MLDTNKFSIIHKLYNLGLHLNNIEKDVVRYTKVQYLRMQHKLSIDNPIILFRQLIYMLNICTRIYINGGKLMIINTEAGFGGKFGKLFEGYNVIC